MQCSYGELGYYLLESFLVWFFPNSVVGGGITSPLSAADFRTFILLPEIAVRLIMADLVTDRQTAIATMQWSIPYGKAQYPCRDNDETRCDVMLYKLRTSLPPVQDAGLNGNEDRVANSSSSLHAQEEDITQGSFANPCIGPRGDITEYSNDSPERKRRRVTEM